MKTNPTTRFSYQRFLIHAAIATALLINVLVFAKLTGAFGCPGNNTVATEKCGKKKEQPVKLEQQEEQRAKDYVQLLYWIGYTAYKNF